MKYLSIFFFASAPCFLVWSIGYWENQISYFIFVVLLLLGIIFATRKPEGKADFNTTTDDPEYLRRREQALVNAQRPMRIIYSPVLWLGGFFVCLVIYIIITKLF